MSHEVPRGSPLRRVVGPTDAVLLGLGSILGSGVFVSLGIAAGVVGDGLVVAVALAALLAIANGLSSAQLAAAHPVSGGTYEYGHRFVHPVAGYAAGWMFLSAKSASAATAALGGAGYLLHLTGSGGGPALPRIAAVATLALTALVAGGMTRSTRVNAVVVGITVVALVTFVLAGAFDPAGTAPTAAAGGAGRPGTGAADPLPGTWSPSALLHATALMFVAYTGYGRIATLGEEVRAPSRTIPRAIIATLLISLLLYVTVAATALRTVGAPAFAAAVGVDAAPLGIAARALRPAWVAPLVAVGAVTAMTGVLLNLILGLSRVVLAMARRGEAPAGLGRIDPGRSSPVRAVWMVGLTITCLTLIGDVRVTWTFSALTVLVYYGLTNLAALRLPAAQRRFPRWIAWCGLVGCLTLTVFIPGPVWIAGAITMAAGFALRAVIRNVRAG